MLNQFKTIEDRLQHLQTQIATGTRIPQSSDQPMDAVTLSARSELERSLGQFKTNLARTEERLRLVDANLEVAVNMATRLNELYISINTATITQAERNAARTEILQMRETMISLSNATDNSGDALFGGFSTEANPFRKQLDGSVKYFGDGGQHTLSVSETVNLPTSLNGADVFLQVDVAGEKKSIFEILSSVSSSLLTNDNFVQSYTAAPADDIELTFNASREPQEWSFTLNGPTGKQKVTAVINSDSPENLVNAINNTSVGVSASASSSGVITIANTVDGFAIGISEIEVEGYNNAVDIPKYYVEVKNKTDNTTRNVSPLMQSIDSQGESIRALVTELALNRTRAGARINNAQAQSKILDNRDMAVKVEIGELRDADIESLITELQTLLVTRDAARQTYTTVANKSLFDFLS